MISFIIKVDLLTTVLDTDYNNWAVLAQCNLPSGGSTSDAKIFSYRFLTINIQVQLYAIMYFFYFSKNHVSKQDSRRICTSKDQISHGGIKLNLFYLSWLRGQRHLL